MDCDRTAQARSDWDRMAATYDRGAGAERFLIGDTRARLCGQARGRTLEVAIGTGLNLGLYPPGTDLVALDLSGGMLEIASKRAEHLDGGVTFVQGDAQRMPFADAVFDTVVCTLALCAVPDQSTVVAEIRRVLGPGGRLLLVDHIEYARLPLRLVERWRSRRHTPRRRPLEIVVEAGFEVERHDRLTLGFVDRVVARRSR
jgi:ubiquinone/menaquinone biosynthesis C-methylase UbiE